MPTTVVGLFPSQTTAEQAVNALIKQGFTNDQIGVSLRGDTRVASASSNDPLLAHTGGDSGTSDARVGAFTDALSYGGVIVTVQTEAAQARQVRAVLTQFGAVDEADRGTAPQDPNDAAVREADAVDRPAVRQVASALNSSDKQADSGSFPVTGGATPLASSQTVAVTEPSGLANLKPGDGD